MRMVIVRNLLQMGTYDLLVSIRVDSLADLQHKSLVSELVWNLRLESARGLQACCGGLGYLGRWLRLSHWLTRETCVDLMHL